MWNNNNMMWNKFHIMPIHITFSHLAFLSHLFCLKVFTVVFFIFLHFALIFITQLLKMSLYSFPSYPLSTSYLPFIF